ncbi:hypothetical protein FPJ27_37130 (plasmid) [Burkholderia sp. MS455]|uniref:hypothetical protein n=1 Tax=Burkholderia sp. MS455 TaxID=2811788 RepID=UPI00195C6AC8|nr:hypothetical protein [Burkholderia sp. MS455]QRR11824.1 hypothetical protein FPJ27_37130 [Burkholderia sp. MS455]
MKRLLAVIFTMIFSAFMQPVLAQTCNNASLNGKYVLSGQGDAYNVCLLGILCLAHSTMSTTGYVVADGNGNITSARLFQATNSGVQDSGIVQSAGTYAITDCGNGTLNLTLNGQASTYNLDVNDVDTGGLAHSGAVLDADAGYDEALQMVRTVDPLGANACGSGFSLNGIATNGIEQGHDTLGNPVSTIESLTYNNGAISGTEKTSTPTGFTTAAISGTYSINSDCTVRLTRTIKGVTTAGVHVVTGGDPNVAELPHVTVWQGDWIAPHQSTLPPLHPTW